MRAILIDDEPLALRRLEQALANNPDCKIVGTSRGGEEALALVAREQPELVFVDIQMPGLNGLELVDALDMPEPPIVIFVTAFQQYAIDAFHSGAVGYLLKPIDEKRLAETLARAREAHEGADARRKIAELRDAVQRLRDEQGRAQSEGTDDVIWVSHRGMSLRIPWREVRQVKAAGDYVSIVTADAEFLHLDSLRSLEDRLDPDRFMRVHRSAIVALPFIESLERASYGRFKLNFDNGEEAFCSRTHGMKLRQRLGMIEN